MSSEGAGNPLGLPQASRNACHEFAVAEWLGRDDIHGPVQVFAVNEELDGAGKVVLVNPADELPSVALRAAQSQPCQVGQHHKSAAGSGAEYDTAAQSHFASTRRIGLKERGLPVFCHVH